MVIITGNTYPVKDELKELGARWDGTHWFVPDDKADQARKIVTGAGEKNPGEKKPFRHTKCVACGARKSSYLPIYKSGECPDCYEERKMGY